MSHLSILVRIAGCSSLILALGSACGGQSFEQEPGKNTGGTVARGGAGQAGSSAKAGSSSQAGASRGGAGSGGTATAGAGGASGSVACDALPDVGPCNALIQAWYHDAATGVCRPFVYGGCQGNDNRYDSLAACQKACPGGSPNYDSCTQASECRVTGNGCCGICDSAGLTAHDFIAYNLENSAAFACGLALKIAAPGDTGVACAPCIPPDERTGTIKYFVPDCVQGQCAVVDLRTSDTTACSTNDDCRLRNGTSCCQGCTATGPVIAANKDGTLEELLCGGEPTPCPACASEPPANASAVCGDSGHCEVKYSP